LGNWGLEALEHGNIKTLEHENKRTWEQIKSQRSKVKIENGELGIRDWVIGII